MSSDGKWANEEIPDSAALFFRVHFRDLDDNGQPRPGAFRNSPKESPDMSTDWCKYATADETRQRGKQSAENYAVVELNAGRTRRVPGQSVEHTPDCNNRAHSSVVGKKTAVERNEFLGIYSMVLPLP